MAERPVHTDMPYRVLGRTGEQVSAIGLGGWHLGFKQVDEQLSLRIVRSAIDHGINFMDNCWDYNGGASETSASTYTCWKSPGTMGSRSIRSRCRST